MKIRFLTFRRESQSSYEDVVVPAITPVNVNAVSIGSADEFGTAKVRSLIGIEGFWAPKVVMEPLPPPPAAAAA